MVLFAASDFIVSDGIERDSIDGVANVALNVIAGAERIADLLPANPADEESELGLNVDEFVAPTTIILFCVSRNVLFGFTHRAFHIADYSKHYIGGMKGALGCTTSPLWVRCITEPLRCDGLTNLINTYGRLSSEEEGSD